MRRFRMVHLIICHTRCHLACLCRGCCHHPAQRSRRDTECSDTARREIRGGSRHRLQRGVRGGPRGFSSGGEGGGGEALRELDSDAAGVHEVQKVQGGKRARKRDGGVVEDYGDDGTDRKRGGQDEAHGEGDGGGGGPAKVVREVEEGVDGAEGGAEGGEEESRTEEEDGSCIIKIQ